MSSREVKTGTASLMEGFSNSPTPEGRDMKESQDPQEYRWLFNPPRDELLRIAHGMGVKVRWYHSNKKIQDMITLKFLERNSRQSY